VLLLVAFRAVGERCWLLWPALFVPPQISLLPLCVLLPLGLLLCPGSVIIDGFVLFLVVFVYMGFRWPITPPRGSGPSVSVVTCNVGQRNSARLSPFIESQKPDLIVLQDAPHKGRRYARQYRDRYVTEHGEFVLISRFPVRSSAPVEAVRWRQHPVAARFAVEWDGQPLLIYAVHLPTPRRELSRIMGVGLIKEWARAHGWLGADPNDSVALSLEARPALVRALCDQIRAEQAPVIVAGDLNMPHWGYMYKVLTERLWDAYRECGKGFGFTFPGTSRNPVTLFGPWLRLDYVFCSRDLRPREARVEANWRAQHRAVAAEFERRR